MTAFASPHASHPVRRLRPLALALLAGAVLAGCAIGPDYRRPEIATPAQFKQADGWRQAAPADALARGAWWELYGDAELNALAERLNGANQTVAQYEAQYRQARALARSARGALFPSVNASVGRTRSGSASSSTGAGAGSVRNSYDAQLSASWELDLWGKLRRTVEAENASTAASLADLAAIRLSLQSELVQNYLQLRVMDEQQRLLQATVEAYRRSLQMTQNQYKAGVAARAEVAQAQTQLKSTEASLVDLRWQRAQLENAIAVLLGVPPADFSLAVREAVPPLPDIPLALPSQLLERRPDIASAERSVIAANAEIGVAEAAWFPDLTLSASGGYSSNSFRDWISVPNRFWSLGPQLALTLFDAGQRSAEVDRRVAAYDQTVAQYRQTVLDGFREVEDYLVQLKVLEEEAAVQREALDAARESLRLSTNQYKAGLISYLDVVSVQTTALSNERSALTLLQSRLIASAQLVVALGGGWHSDLLDAEESVAAE